MKNTISKFATFLFAILLLVNLQGCALLGFGIGSITDSNKAKNETSMSVETANIIEPGTRVEILNDKGFIYKGDFKEVSLWEIGGDTIDVVIILAKNRPIGIATENIEKITIAKKKKNGKWVGIGLGAAIDVAVITAIAKGGKKTGEGIFEGLFGAFFSGGN